MKHPERVEDYLQHIAEAMRRLLSARLNLQPAAGDNQLALEALALLAAIETKTTSGPAFEQAFRRYYREACDPVR
jgi:hypothetical protein